MTLHYAPLCQYFCLCLCLLPSYGCQSEGLPYWVTSGGEEQGSHATQMVEYSPLEGDVPKRIRK